MGTGEQQPARQPSVAVEGGAKDASLLVGQKSPTLSWLINVGLLVAACVVAVLVTEVALRLAGISHPILTEPDIHTGGRHRPGTKGWNTSENRQWIVINSDGRRDREHSVKKPPGTLRIAVLGDSYAEAAQVDIDDAFWAVAERELGKCPALGGRKVEALNFGVGGFGTAQELLTLRHRAWRYSPDVVVLAFLTGNDVTDNYRPAGREDAEPRPYFVLRDGSLTLDDSFLQSPKFRSRQTLPYRLYAQLRTHSRVLQLLTHLRVLRRSKAALPNSLAERVALGSDHVYGEPDTEQLAAAWEVTEAIVAQMHREVRGKGARFLLVTLSNPVQVHPDESIRQQAMALLNGSDLFYADRRMEELAAAEGIDILSLARPLAEYAVGHQAFLHGFADSRGWGHWNHLGHRLAGQQIAAHLCAQLSRAP